MSKKYIILEEYDSFRPPILRNKIYFNSPEEAGKYITDVIWKDKTKEYIDSYKLILEGGSWWMNDFEIVELVPYD